MAFATLPEVAAKRVHFQFIDVTVGNTLFSARERAAAGAADGVDAPTIRSFQGEHKLSLPGREMLRRHLIFDGHLQQQVTVPDTGQASPPYSPVCWTCDDLNGANALKPGALLAKTPDES